MGHSQLEAVVAVANNGTIGRNQQLPWRLSSDLKRFRAITMGHCLLMGRKTYESIGKPLPGRETIVMSRQEGLRIPQCQVVQTYEQALGLAGDRRVFVVGGAEIYRLLFPFCGAIHVTRVLAEIAGDAHLDPIDLTRFRCTESAYVPASISDEWPTVYEHWERQS